MLFYTIISGTTNIYEDELKCNGICLMRLSVGWPICMGLDMDVAENMWGLFIYYIAKPHRMFEPEQIHL